MSTTSASQKTVTQAAFIIPFYHFCTVDVSGEGVVLFFSSLFKTKKLICNIEQRISVVFFSNGAVENTLRTLCWFGSVKPRIWGRGHGGGGDGRKARLNAYQLFHVNF